ncbi:hypothetical protein [Streptomyces niveus]|uniref:hypothetical protein n=1 Tax=Streptomyces niveus TaxID=193462 RepID=UPI003794C42D
MTPKGDVYQRYMAASAARREHARTCAVCTPESACAAGARLYEQFSRLQDAYNKQLRERS